MTDIASLGLRIDSTQVDQGTAALGRLAAAGGRAETSAEGLARASREAGAGFGAMAGGAQLVGVALAGLGLLGVGAALGRLKDVTIEYGNSLREVSTLVDTAKVSMADLSETALKQAGAFGSTPLVQTKALYQIISAGASTAAQATETLTAANKLAVGGVTDVRTAADGLTSVLNAYGSKVGSATEVSDAMFTAMKAGKTTIAELSGSLGVVAPLAAQMGVSFDELTAATAALTKGGISTNVAVTGLRAILAAVAKPSDEAAKLAKALGFEFNAAALESKGLTGFLEDLTAKTGGNTDALAMLFGGVEALVPVMALAGQAGQDFTAIMGQMDVKAGATDEALKKIQSGAGAQVAIIFATLAANAIGAAAGIAEALTPALTTIANLITGAEKPTLLLDLAMKALAITTGVVLVRAIGGFVVSAVLGSSTMLAFAASAAIVGPAAAAASVGVSALGAAVKIALGPIGWAIAAVGLLATAWRLLEDGSKSVEAAMREEAAAAGAGGAEYLRLRDAAEAAAKAQGNVGANANGAANGLSVALTEAQRLTAAMTALGIEAQYTANQLALVGLARAREAQDEVKGRFDFNRSTAGQPGRANIMGAGLTVELNAATKELQIATAVANQTASNLRSAITDAEKRKAQAAKDVADAASARAAAAVSALKADPDKKAAATDAERAAKQQLKDSQNFLQSLKDETAQIGLNSLARKEWEIATEAGKAPTEALTAAIREQGAALIAKAQIEAADVAGLNDRLAMLTLETSLIGASNAERAVKLAQLAEEQRLLGAGGPALVNSSAGRDAVAKAGEVAAAQEALRTGQEAYNASLTATLDLLTDIDAQAQDAAAGMAKAFGKVGGALGDVLTLMTSYAAKQEQFSVRRKAEGVTAQEVAKIDREAARAKVGHYGSMIGAAQGFFKEGTAGYKALQVAEQVYRAWEFAASVQAMIQKQTEAGVHVTSNAVVSASNVATTGIKIAADATGAASHAAAGAVIMATDTATAGTGIAAGAARIFAALGPFGFPIVAAMLAVMAGLGMGGGGGGSAGIPISERRQKEQGAGSVLGDASAKSESIANSLQAVAANTNRDLEFSNDMLKALRSIDNQIGVVASALAQSFGVGGMLDPSKLGLGTSSAGPSGLQRLFLPISNLLPGLFGSKTTRTLQDQGVQFGAGSLGEIMSGGLSGSAYQDILSTTKKKAFGITYSEKTKSSTQTTALDGDFLRQTELLIASLRDGVLAAAGALGVVGAEATLAAFRVDLGKLSFKDLTGDEIQKALEGIFGKLADNMAGAVLPALTDLQNVGEGLFETLTRVARQYQVVDVTLASIGKTFGMVGVASLGAREQLVDLFGGLDEFTERTAFYADNFLSEAERLAPVQSAVNAELARLGLTGLKTRDQFKAVVQGLDVSTAAGANLYAALLSLAPAFAKVTEEAQAVTDAKSALSDAYGRESDALKTTIDDFGSLASSLGKYALGLSSGPAAALSPEDQYKAARAAFEQTATLASAGNQTALGDLQGVSEAYLDASKSYFASSRGYFDDLAAVRAAVTAAEASATQQVDTAQAQLEAMTAQVGQLIDLNENVVSVVQAIAALTAVLAPASGPAAVPVTVGGTAPPTSPSAANDNAALVAELQAIRAELAAGNEQRGAVGVATIRRLEAAEDQLSRLIRANEA
jgi:TP901 family phage tail tape measure protein